MKKEIEAVLEDKFLSSVLDNFYEVDFTTTDVKFQGHYNSEIVKAISEKYSDCNWKVTENGFLEKAIKNKQQDNETKMPIIKFIFT